MIRLWLRRRRPLHHQLLQGTAPCPAADVGLTTGLHRPGGTSAATVRGGSSSQCSPSALLQSWADELATTCNPHHGGDCSGCGQNLMSSWISWVQPGPSMDWCTCVTDWYNEVSRRVRITFHCCFNVFRRHGFLRSASISSPRRPSPQTTPTLAQSATSRSWCGPPPRPWAARGLRRPHARAPTSTSRSVLHAPS